MHLYGCKFGMEVVIYCDITKDANELSYSGLDSKKKYLEFDRLFANIFEFEYSLAVSRIGSRASLSHMFANMLMIVLIELKQLLQLSSFSRTKIKFFTSILELKLEL